MAAIGNPAPAAAPAPKAWQAALLAPVVLVLAGVFIGICVALGSVEFYAGFFFLLYWAGLQHASVEALPSSVFGSFLGVALGLALQQLTTRLGAAVGAGVFVALLIPILYLQIRRQLTLLINNATMMLLTAAGISHVQAHASFRGMFISLALAVVLAGGPAWALSKRKRALAPGQVQAAE